MTVEKQGSVKAQRKGTYQAKGIKESFLQNELFKLKSKGPVEAGIVCPKA